MGLREGGGRWWWRGALSFNLAALLLQRGVCGVRQPSGERGHHAVTIIISPSPLLMTCKLITESDGGEQSHSKGFFFFRRLFSCAWNARPLHYQTDCLSERAASSAT